MKKCLFIYLMYNIFFFFLIYVDFHFLALAFRATYVAILFKSYYPSFVITLENFFNSEFLSLETTLIASSY